MRTTCPNCGAPIEFRYDDSFVRICGHCNFAVQRTDRGVESLGKVADLAPIESPLRLFAEGHYGTTSFLLVGMAQIAHDAGGIWQEWYAKLDGGQWGWLAEAQGRYYLTFEVPWLAAPNQVTVGDRLEVPLPGGAKTMTVGESTEAVYASAKGELPFRLVPNERFRYADLSDGQGAFATLDFGDEDTPPKLYAGSQVELADLRLSGGEVGPPPSDTEIESKALACPVCSAPIEIRLPDSQRVVCGHCNTLLDSSEPVLAILGQLASRAVPTIPLGSKGTFSEGELVVIGYVQRSALVDGDWWPFEEYLLYRAGLGYRWLVRSDGHWSYVQPIATGAVEVNAKGARYDGVDFLRYQTADLRVDEVLGELYWKVQQGEQVSSEDLIAPPAMVSRESTATEENWSLSTFMTSKQVIAAFEPAVQLPIGDGDGIAPNQPDAWKTAASVLSIAFFVLVVLGMVFAMAAKNDTVLSTTVSLGGGPGGGAALVPQPSDVTTSFVDPATVPVCAEYKTVFLALASCEHLSQADHESYTALYSATYIPTDRSLLELGCKTGLDSMRQGLAGTCTLPTHDQYLATITTPPPAPATGSGSDTPENEVTTAPADSIWFSEPLQIAGGRNLELEFTASSLANDWVFVSADLVETSTGGVVSGEASIEHYSGFEDGESWSEGNLSSSTVFGPQPAGTYILRLEAQHGSAGLMPITVTLKQGVFRGKWLGWAIGLLSIPLLIVGMTSYFHEKKRWENSTFGKAPFTPVGILVIAVVGVFIGLGALIKALMESSSSSDD